MVDRGEKKVNKDRCYPKTQKIPRAICAGSHVIHCDQRTQVMGIVNMTPDSFSDGGKYNQLDAAFHRAEQLVEKGVDILDIGGESTRPGAHKVSMEEELKRVIPLVERCAKELNVPLSIDTYKAEVARQAVDAGAHIINDISGATKDPQMAQVAAWLKVPLVITHNQRHVDSPSCASSFAYQMVEDMLQMIQYVKEAGVSNENIILDPGIGFSKSAIESMMALKEVHQLVQLGFPVLLGTSRKSFIGSMLDKPVDKRLPGTLATIAYGIMQGCCIVRVHDVEETVDVCRMIDILVREEANG